MPIDETTAPAPIACTLTAPEMRARREGLLRRVRERIVEARPAAAAAMGDAFELRFAGDEETVAEVLDLVRLESRCCAFLRFRVTIEPRGAALLLEISGPPGGAAILAEELLPAAPPSRTAEPTEEKEQPC
jgi:hypothetical protein